MKQANDFAKKVRTIVAAIPPGKVMSYGQIALLAGSPRGARIVGGIAHYGNTDLPWHRVVTKDGHMGSGFPGGASAQASMLKHEGIELNDNVLDNIENYRWQP